MFYKAQLKGHVKDDDGNDDDDNDDDDDSDDDNDDDEDELFLWCGWSTKGC